jgi:hypothetical protein
MAVGDDLPLLPAGATPTQPSIAEQQRQHTEQQAPSGVALPLAPAPPPGILDSSWSVAGKQLWDKGSRGVGLGTRDVVEGGTTPVTGVLDLATWPMRALQRAFGVPTTAPSDLVTKSLDAAGLPTPQTPTEQNISTFNRGTASVLPSIVVGGMPTVAARVPAVAQPFVAAPTASGPQAVRALVAGGTGAVAGEKAAGSDLVPAWLKPTVNIAAAIAGARFADVGANLGAKTYNAVAGNVSPTYNAFVRAGVDPRLLGTVAGGELGQSAEAAMSRVPFASSVMRPVQQNTIDQFGNSVERTASQLDPGGVGVTAQTTGDHLQSSYRNWVDNVFNGPQGRQAAAWSPLNQRMAGASVDAAPFRSALTDAAKPPNLASLPETQKAWASGQAQRWLKALNADIGSGNLTWEQAQAIRTRIGDAMGTPGIADAVGMQQLRRMYGGLAQGMENSAVANGQGTLFRDANAVTTEGHAFIENVGSKIAKANNPAQETVTPDTATKNILDSGDTTMQAVRRELPDAADTLAAFKLRQAQTAKPSVAGAYDDTSTGTWLTNMNRTRQQTPGGYGALYGDPAIQGQLGDLTEVARRLRATERHLNTSGTAEQLGWMDYLRGIREAASSGSVGDRLLSTAAAVTVPPTIGIGGGRLMTSPLATRFAAAQGAGRPLLGPRVTGLLGSQATIPEITVRPQPGQ